MASPLIDAVLTAAIIYLIFRSLTLRERIDLLESAVRKLAPRNAQIGGRSIRFSVSMKAMVNIANRQHPVLVRDLSMSGAQVQAPVHLQVGQIVSLELNDGEKATQANAKVARVIAPGQFGVQFILPSLSFKRMLKSIRDRSIADSMSIGEHLHPFSEAANSSHEVVESVFEPDQDDSAA